MRYSVRSGALAFCVLLSSLAAGFQQQPAAQHLSGMDRDRARAMLQMIASDVKKHYYDSKFHGLDWDARVQQARERIDGSPSLNAAFLHIAGALDSLNDSHTFFVPPRRPYKHDYGFQMQIIGDRCYVNRVRPQSDAETKELRAGDEVLALSGYAPDRSNLWKMNYVNGVLRPQAALRLSVRSVGGSERELEVAAKMRPDGTQIKEPKDVFNDLIREGEDDFMLARPRIVEMDDLMILKIPVFLFSDSDANDMIGKAKRHKNLIIDLRSNPGGAEDSLKYLIGLLFDKDIKIGDRVRREDRKELIAKSRRNPFMGKLVVLVDSDSASAAELLARVVQLEKRGTVMGDHTSGSVMEAKRYGYETGMGIVSFFGASITEADLIMTDGKSLEHAGVTPDEISIPTATDLSAGRDPVLAHAAELLGFKISASDAGKFFPYQWPKP